MNSFRLRLTVINPQQLLSHAREKLGALARRFFRSERHTSLFPTMHGEIVNGEKMLDARNISVYVMSAVMFILLALSITLNAVEGTTALLPPLIAAAGVAVAGFLWMYWVGTRASQILLLLNFTLMAVGLFLFLQQGAPDGSSLFWFIVFPPMVMVSLGLRQGSIVFGCFFLALFLFLFTRLDVFLAYRFSQSIRVRFMLAMFGAFLFSWWVEYLRFRAHNLLLKAMNALEHESLTDTLTGLGNRRDFYNILARVMAGSRRTEEPYVLAFLDLDHFKRVNDTYGHHIGDKMLHHVAATIEGQIRDTDRLFRWGGEEFALLMPNCDCEQAHVATERIRRQVAAAAHVEPGIPAPLSVTVSIGFYCGTEAFERDVPVRVADANLYAAKEAGRNRVVFKYTASSTKIRSGAWEKRVRT